MITFESQTFLGMKQVLGYFLGFAIFIAGIPALMMLQVRSEEKRLEADFGDEYLEYKKRTGRFITLKK